MRSVARTRACSAGWRRALALVLTSAAAGALLRARGAAHRRRRAITSTALRFGGGGIATPDADRLKIRVDPPTAADLGATNFTIELWMLATKADNSGGDAACDGANYSWINGRIIVDRDRFPGGASADGRDWGISLTTTGRVVFGLQNAGGAQWTTCTSGVDVLDGAWHHVAVQRATTGLMQIWVDGVLRAQATGPSGDVSYPNNAGTVRPNSDPYLVIGAEKHDAGAEFPSYRGLVDEVRLSTRCATAATFTRPSAPVRARTPRRPLSTTSTATPGCARPRSPTPRPTT